jgi:DNA/RNA non-specific endonuclease
MQSYLTKVTATVMIFCAAPMAPLLMSHPANAQSTSTMQNVVPQSEAVMLQGKITAIEPSTRAITLRGPEGNSLTVIAGPLVRLNLLQVGQTVNVKYYRSVAFVISPPKGGNGVPVTDDQFTQAIAQPTEAPGGVAVRVVKVSGTIVSIDHSSNSLSIVNPSGGRVYTIDVTDPARIAVLGTLHVGDTVSAVVSEVLAVSVDPAPKNWY